MKNSQGGSVAQSFKHRRKPAPQSGAARASAPSKPNFATSESALEKRLAELEREGRTADEEAILKAKLELRSVQAGVWHLLNVLIPDRVFVVALREPKIREVYIALDSVLTGIKRDREAQVKQKEVTSSPPNLRGKSKKIAKESRILNSSSALSSGKFEKVPTEALVEGKSDDANSEDPDEPLEKLEGTEESAKLSGAGYTIRDLDHSQILIAHGSKQYNLVQAAALAGHGIALTEFARDQNLQTLFTSSSPTPLRIAIVKLAEAAQDGKVELGKVYEAAALACLDVLLNTDQSSTHSENIWSQSEICQGANEDDSFADSQESMLVLAAQAGSERLCRTLCEQGAFLEALAVFKAVENGQFAAADWLLRHIAINGSPEESQFAQQTIVHVIVESAANGTLQMHHYNKLMDTITELCIPVTVYNYLGRTPLHVACIEQSVDPIAVDLLARGADPSAIDAYGRTPEMYLSRLDNGALISMFSFYAHNDASAFRVLAPSI